MTQWIRDVQHAIRTLVRQPAFTTVAVLTLALGIGANTAIYSVVDALLLEPLPFPASDRLVRIESVRGGEAGSISYRESRDMRELTRIFAGVAVYTDQGQYNASGDGRPEELVSTIATQDLFEVLGVAPVMGASWPEVLDRTRDFKVLISHSLWQRRFDGAPDVVGRAMTLDGAPGYTILGVLPRGFAFPVRADLYRSHGISSIATDYEDRSNRGRWGIARLRDGVTLAQAQAALTDLARRLERDFPASNTGIGYRVSSLRDLYVGDVRPYLILTLGAVGLVLLIACANVANLLVARAIGRSRELAVRTALGAGRSVLARLLVTEGVVLSLAAGVVGVGFGLLGVRAAERLVRADLPIWMTLDVSPRVLLVTAAISLLTGVLAASAPLWRLGRGDLTVSLKEGGVAAGDGVRQGRLRSVLVAVEIALAVVLLAGAGLLVRSVGALARNDPGFNADSLLTFRVELGWRAYPGLASTVTFQQELLRRAGELPGVRSAAVIDNLPFDGRPRRDATVRLEGQSDEELRANPLLNQRVVSPSLFETLRIPVRSGRSFLATDRDSSLQVVLVSEAAARRLWPGRDPLGARMELAAGAAQPTWATVIGVVGDVRHEGPASEPALDVYRPMEQLRTGSLYLLVRTQGDPLSLARQASELVWAIDPNQSFFDVRTMQARVTDRTWVIRLSGVMFTAFGVLATVLAAIGVYAVLAFAVAQRTRELGVRQALGATPRELATLVLRGGLRLVAIGGAVGLVSAFVLSRLLRHLFHGVGVLDLPTFLSVPALLLAVAGLACWLPARRAARVSPLEAIRARG